MKKKKSKKATKAKKTKKKKGKRESAVASLAMFEKAETAPPTVAQRQPIRLGQMNLIWNQEQYEKAVARDATGSD